MIVPVVLTFILLASCPSDTLAQLPTGDCSLEDFACSIDDGNLIGVISGISSVEECRQACEDTTARNNIRTYNTIDGTMVHEPFI